MGRVGNIYFTVAVGVCYSKLFISKMNYSKRIKQLRYILTKEVIGVNILMRW